LTDWVYSDSNISIGRFNQYQYNKEINAYHTRNVQNRPLMLMYTGWQMLLLDVLLWRCSCNDFGLTSQENYSVQQFLYAFILFWTLHSTKYLHLHHLRENRNDWLPTSGSLSGGV